MTIYLSDQEKWMLILNSIIGGFSEPSGVIAWLEGRKDQTLDEILEDALSLRDGMICT